MSDKIVQLRGESIKGCDLSQFFTSKQALESGLVDNVDRVFNAIPKTIPNVSFTVLKQSKLEEIKAAIRNGGFHQASFHY